MMLDGAKLSSKSAVPSLTDINSTHLPEAAMCYKSTAK
jgi:hypothetical protein